VAGERAAVEEDWFHRGSTLVIGAGRRADPGAVAAGRRRTCVPAPCVFGSPACGAIPAAVPPRAGRVWPTARTHAWLAPISRMTRGRAQDPGRPPAGPGDGAPEEAATGVGSARAPAQRPPLLALHQQGARQVAVGHLELFAAAQILHRHHALGRLVLAADHHEADPGAVGVLHLLAELARLELGLDVESGR